MPKKLRDGDTLNIWGRDYTLNSRMDTQQLSDYSGYEQCVGLHEPSTKTIYVARDVDMDERKSTLLHEIFEAFKYMFNWKNLPEEQIHTLERASYYTFKENGIEIPDIE